MVWCGADNVGIFIGLCPAFDNWRGQNRLATGFQHAEYFGQGFGIIDMLKHMVANDPVIVISRQASLFNIDQMWGHTPVAQIGGFVICDQPFDQGGQLHFGREMQHVVCWRKEPIPLNVQHKQTVPFQRTAPATARVKPWRGAKNLKQPIKAANRAGPRGHPFGRGPIFAALPLQIARLWRLIGPKLREFCRRRGHRCVN